LCFRNRTDNRSQFQADLIATTGVFVLQLVPKNPHRELQAADTLVKKTYRIHGWEKSSGARSKHHVCSEQLKTTLSSVTVPTTFLKF